MRVRYKQCTCINVLAGPRVACSCAPDIRPEWLYKVGVACQEPARRSAQDGLRRPECHLEPVCEGRSFVQAFAVMSCAGWLRGAEYNTINSTSKVLLQCFFMCGKNYVWVSNAGQQTVTLEREREGGTLNHPTLKM